jgi:hypothetical protein
MPIIGFPVQIICDKIISYGAWGRVSLIEHSNSNEHAEKLKLKDSNYTLGVSKANSKSYGIHSFSRKQQSCHVTPLKHISPFPREPVFAFAACLAEK